ncbi:cobalamin-independent synthase, Catalytic domain protein, partial [Vibrio parahaemolyticus V-223/04]
SWLGNLQRSSIKKRKSLKRQVSTSFSLMSLRSMCSSMM